MSNPNLQRFCCAVSDNSTVIDAARLDPHFLQVYDFICFVSSVIAVICCIWQLFCNKRDVPFMPFRRYSYVRQNFMLTNLFFADLFAASALVIRSMVWFEPMFRFHDFEQHGSASMRRVCFLSSSVVQFFYNCGYLWLLCYAIDCLRIMSCKASLSKTYFFVAWAAPLALSIFCGLTESCFWSDGAIWAQRLVSYLPMLLVMLATPIVFCIIEKQSINPMQAMEIQGSRSFGSAEIAQNIRSTLRVKHCRIMLAFFGCWMPNLVNGLLDVRNPSPFDISGYQMAMWILMAILNPLQSFFYCQIFSKFGPACCFVNVPFYYERTFHSESDREASAESRQSLVKSEESTRLD